MAKLTPGITAEDLLTPEWLADALQLPVVGAELKSVGTGQIGDCERVTLTYAEPCDGPATVVAKIPSQDPTSRNAGVALGTYRKESRFYLDLRNAVTIAAPQCHYVDFDDETCEFVLLLEDAAPAEQGDQLAGCTVDQAELAVLELPKMHAPFWGDASARHSGVAGRWLQREPGDDRPVPRHAVPGFQGTLRRAHRRRHRRRWRSDMLTKMGQMYDFGDRPETLTHGDYRLDNMLFGDPRRRPADHDRRLADGRPRPRRLGPQLLHRRRPHRRRPAQARGRSRAHLPPGHERRGHRHLAWDESVVAVPPPHDIGTRHGDRRVAGGRCRPTAATTCS